jgi:hypothetical protein
LQVVKCIHGLRAAAGVWLYFPRLRGGDACGIVQLTLALGRIIVQ